MGNEKTEAAIKKILKKRDAVKADDKSVNLIIDILKSSQSKNDEIVSATCESLGDIFSHLISAHQFLDSSKMAVAEADQSEEDQFSAWLKEQYTTTCDILCGHLSHETHAVQVSSLNALVAILQAGDDKESLKSANLKLIEDIMAQFLDSDRDQTELGDSLPSLLNAWEGSTEITAACLSYVKKTLKNVRKSQTDVFLLNCWRVIRNITGQEIDDKSRRVLTGVVCEFLKNKMPTSLYREILTSLSPIMEKMSSPIRLADFLSESFNVGGAVSLLSLHGLFILMHKYNLDYPDFYNKLYSMFEPHVFSAKYRARFFHLAETFLSSTHLPAYLIAAFAKRLARISLHAPASGIQIAIPFILNLLARHPACEVLLHRTGDCLELDSDPFLSDETDTAKCKALDSCLWELQTLERHYDPSVSQMAKKRTIAERDLGPLLENTTNDIITSEAKKVKPDVAVTFVKPKELELPRLFTL